MSTDKKSPDNTLKRPKKRWLRAFLWSTGSILIIMVAALLVIYLYLESQLPDVSKLKDVHLQVPMRIYDQSGGLIAQYGEKRRIPLRFEDIPKPLIQALLATEDSRFYDHPGVDLVGLARAAMVVLKSGKKEQGASTITMQVARNFYLSRQKTYSRKIREILLALKIDKALSKDKILSLYLNKVYFGNRAYGVGAAANVYYGKPINQLTLAQMAMIAGLPQSPSKNNPIRNPEGAQVRRNHVLERMFALKEITQAQYQHAIDEPVTASYHHQKIDLNAPYVASMVYNNMTEQYGEGASEMGLVVNTSINEKMQVAARKALQRGLINYSLRHGYRGPEGFINDPDNADLTAIFKNYPTNNELMLAVVTAVNDKSVDTIDANNETHTILWPGLRWARQRLPHLKTGPLPQQAADILKIGDIIRIQHYHHQWRLAQWPQVQGAIIALKPKTGQVLALSGGFSYKTSAFNRATQAHRQPGSCFKPFIYSAALNKGFTLASIINDAPIVIRDSGENELWRPTNDTKKFYGPTTLRTGLAKSRNLVSIRLLEKIGIPYTVNYLQRFGFNPKDLPHTLSLALGSAELTPYQLIQSFNVFANGGYLLSNHLIQNYQHQGSAIQTPQHMIICSDSLEGNPLNNKQTQCAKPSITPQNDYIMTQALKGVIENGTGRAAKVLRRHDLAGKTGTTNRQLHPWFVGYNRDLIAVVWVGFDDLNSLREYGSRAALPIWIDFMKAALKHQPNANLSQPDNIVMVRINKKTGEKAEQNTKDTRFEVFRTQYAPQQNSAPRDQKRSPAPTEPDTSNETDTDTIF